MATAHALPLARSSSNLRNYVLVTAAYWADTLTDGAVRMLVLVYYMANACGRLAGTVLSGLLYQYFGLIGCLWTCVGLVLASAALARLLPSTGQVRVSLAAIGGEEEKGRPGSSPADPTLARSVPPQNDHLIRSSAASAQDAISSGNAASWAR